MITFLKETNTFFLENERVTYAFGIRNGELEHLWFGAKIGHDDLTYLRTAIGSGCDAGQPGRYSPNHHSQELPVYGQGDFREPMLTWRGENGDLGSMPVDDFIARLKDEAKNRVIKKINE